MIKMKHLKSRKIKPSKSLYLLIFFLITISCNWSTSEKKDKDQITVLKGDAKISEPSKYIVDVTALDYAFNAPEEILSGWVTFRMKNMGKEEHVAIIARFADTISLSRLQELIQKSRASGTIESYSKVSQFVNAEFGGPGLLSPNKSGETTVFLEPGLYAWACGVKSADGETHFQKGMIRAFKVVERKAASEKPNGTVNISLTDFAISTKDSIGPGMHVFDVKFEDRDGHDVHLARLKPDQSLEDLEKWMLEVKVPSPYEFLGGAEQVPEGMHSTFKANLEPGRYAFVSHHLSTIGMSEEFNISENKKVPPLINKPVNPAVTISSGMDGTQYPKKVPVGRTPIIIKNDGTEAYNYYFSKVKQGYTEKQFLKYVKDIYVNEIWSTELEKPLIDIYYGTIKPGQEKKFNLEMEESNYYLIGPFLTDKKWKAQWRENNLIHKITGVNSSISQQ